jgi:hypothetical protein
MDFCGLREKFKVELFVGRVLVNYKEVTSVSENGQNETEVELANHFKVHKVFLAEHRLQLLRIYLDVRKALLLHVFLCWRKFHKGFKPDFFLGSSSLRLLLDLLFAYFDPLLHRLQSEVDILVFLRFLFC